jgi:hypothetical protein
MIAVCVPSNEKLSLMGQSRMRRITNKVPILGNQCLSSGDNRPGVTAELEVYKDLKGRPKSGIAIARFGY